MTKRSLKYSACIDMMYADRNFEDRFAAAAADGMDAVEFWKWSNKDLDRVEALLQENNLVLSIFNIDVRNEKLSYDLSRGILNAGRRDEFLRALRESAPVFHRLHAAAMIVLIGETLPGLSREEQLDNIARCLEAAIPVLEAEDLKIVVEPLNATDRKNYFLPESAPLFSILNQIDSPRVQMLYDIYHQQMTEGHLLSSIRENIARIGHFHVADCPGRHEPGTGKIHYHNVLTGICELPYSGYIGLEYRATRPDSETLDFRI